MIEKALKHISDHRGNRHGLRLLDVIYGPQAKTLRTVLAAMLLDRKVTGSDKMAQYGNLRTLLLKLVGASGNCIAAEDSDFEQKAEAILNMATYPMEWTPEEILRQEG